MVLDSGIRGDRLQIVMLLMIRTPRPFICSKKERDFTARMNMTISRGLISVPVAIISTVTAMRGIEAVAEGGDQLFGCRAGGLVGDLLGEIIALAELLAERPDDILGVAVVLGKDQGLGHICPGRERSRSAPYPGRSG